MMVSPLNWVLDGFVYLLPNWNVAPHQGLGKVNVAMKEYKQKEKKHLSLFENDSILSINYIML